MKLRISIAVRESSPYEEMDFDGSMSEGSSMRTEESLARRPAVMSFRASDGEGEVERAWRRERVVVVVGGLAEVEAEVEEAAKARAARRR